MSRMMSELMSELISELMRQTPKHGNLRFKLCGVCRCARG